jgi:hypothetical protein
VHWVFNFLNSLYILNINLLTKIFFFPSCRLSLHWGNCFLCWSETFEFDAIPFVISCSYFLNYQSLLQKVIAYTCIFSILLMFSSSIFKVLCLTLLFYLFGIDFCTGWEIRIEFLSSTCGYSVFLAPFVKEVSFMPIYLFGTFVKNQRGLFRGP